MLFKSRKTDTTADTKSRASKSLDHRLQRPEHDPEKCEAVFRKDHAQSKELKRDDDSINLIAL
jgi:hypothetical protein